MADNTYTNISDLPEQTTLSGTAWVPVENDSKEGSKFDLNSIKGAGTLNTTATAGQATNANESLSGSIKLHKVAKTGSYSDLLSKPKLNTSLTAAQSTATNETLSGTINLHKVSKTGTYSDLNNLPVIAFETIPGWTPHSNITLKDTITLNEIAINPCIKNLKPFDHYGYQEANDRDITYWCKEINNNDSVSYRCHSGPVPMDYPVDYTSVEEYSTGDRIAEEDGLLSTLDTVSIKYSVLDFSNTAKWEDDPLHIYEPNIPHHITDIQRVQIAIKAYESHVSTSETDLAYDKTLPNTYMTDMYIRIIPSNLTSLGEVDFRIYYNSAKIVKNDQGENETQYTKIDLVDIKDTYKINLTKAGIIHIIDNYFEVFQK